VAPNQSEGTPHGPPQPTWRHGAPLRCPERIPCGLDSSRGASEPDLTRRQHGGSCAFHHQTHNQHPGHTLCSPCPRSVHTMSTPCPHPATPWPRPVHTLSKPCPHPGHTPRPLPVHALFPPRCTTRRGFPLSPRSPADTLIAAAEAVSEAMDWVPEDEEDGSEEVRLATPHPHYTPSLHTLTHTLHPRCLRTGRTEVRR
jgi:hypothetical protein